MIKFEIYLGLNDKDTKQQEITTLDAYKIAGNICGDCSISELTGIYTHEDGTAIIEKSFKIELFEKTAEQVEAIANQLKTAFNQEAVIVNKVNVTSRFI